MGYPGLDLSEPSEDVEGFVFRSERLSEHWPELDAFEGEAYERVVATVTLTDGTGVEAFVYALKQR